MGSAWLTSCCLVIVLFYSFCLTSSATDLILADGNHFRIYQHLNHFDFESHALFPQEFIVYDNSYNPLEGPVLIYATFDTIYSSSNVPKSIQTIADNLQALVIVLPVRFFGNAREPDSFFTMNNLQYLTINQMIADLIRFISILKRESFMNIDENTQFFGMGMHFLGSICVWARQQQPQLIKGCITQDAILYFQENNVELDEQLHYALQRYELSCENDLQKLVQELETHLAGFNQQKQAFLDEFSDYFSDFSEYDMLRIVSQKIYIMIEQGLSKQLCLQISTQPTFKSKLNYILECQIDGDVHLSPLFSNVPLKEDDISLHENLRSVSRLWFWMQCTQVGLFETTSTDKSVSSPHIDATYFRRKCNSIFSSASSTTFFNYENLNQEFNQNLRSLGNILIIVSNLSPWSEAISMINQENIFQMECAQCSVFGFLNQSGNNKAAMSLLLFIVEQVKKWNIQD